MIISILYKVDFHAKKITKDREGYYIIITGSVHQDVAILNAYGSNNKAAKCKTTNDRTERKNRQINNYSWTFQHFVNNQLNN